MKLVLTHLLLLFCAGHAAEIQLTDSAKLLTPTDAPDPAKTYWLAVAVADKDGKGTEGIASWASGDVIVLSPTFGDAKVAADTYEMAGPAHVTKLKELICEIGKKWKLQPKVFLYGYAAGAGFVHRFAMKEPGLVAGVAAASGDLWSNRGYGEINPAARGIPFSISCGEYDRGKVSKSLPLSWIDWSKEFGAELEKANFDVVTRVIENNGHQPHADAFELAKSCFARARALNFSRTALLALDFNGSDPLWGLMADADKAKPSVTATARWDEASGTVEEAGTAVATGAIRLEVNSGPFTPKWSGSWQSGLLPVRSVESDLKKLTLACDLSASIARPVQVVIESFDAARQRTGGLAGLMIPAAPNFYHRHVLDLGTMTASGAGEFQPQDPYVRVSFRVGDDLGWPATAGHIVKVDNLGYAAPAIYMKSGGDDKNDGSSADRPLATVQKAVDRAKAGDVIMVMDGTYTATGAVANIKGTGAPAAWLVLRAHPDHKPVFRTTGWDCIKIGQGTKDAPSTAPGTGYVELRGLTIQGYAKDVEAKYKDKSGKPEPETNGNGNGISFAGRFQTNKPHHLRVADCIIFDCPGGGISAIQTDRVSIENNHTYDNCHWMIHAGSGISVYQGFNFENTPVEYRMLVRNNRSHYNYCTLPWSATGKLSDGNGIIVDDMRNTQHEVQATNGIYHGRILIQGNLSYLNGGSGMHAFSSNHVDFINNTAYGNNIVMDYSQIGLTACSDSRMLNNIIVAPADKPINRVNGSSKDIVISHNLYWGDNGPPVASGSPVTADPLFVNAAAGDFRLKPGSPALGAGGLWENLPVTYQDASLRRTDSAPVLGAMPVAGQ